MKNITKDRATRTPLKTWGELRCYYSNKPGHKASIMKGYDCNYDNLPLGCNANEYFVIVFGEFQIPCTSNTT